MKKLAFVLSAGLVLAACGQTAEKHEEHSKTEASVQPVNVELTVPEKAEAGEEVTLKAKVTQADKAINDADEVMFEIVKDGKNETSIKKKVKEAKDGVYTLPYTFKEDGSYEVTSHVTAENQHTMPNKTILIGNAEKPAAAHDHHDGSVHVMPITAEKDKAVELMMHVEGQDGKAKEGVKARLEVKQPDGKVKWVDLEETKPGQYEGQETFTQSGMYDVTAHAENKEGFHVHTETMFTVK